MLVSPDDAKKLRQDLATKRKLIKKSKQWFYEEWGYFCDLCALSHPQAYGGYIQERVRMALRWLKNKKTRKEDAIIPETDELVEMKSSLSIEAAIMDLDANFLQLARTHADPDHYLFSVIDEDNELRMFFIPDIDLRGMLKDSPTHGSKTDAARNAGESLHENVSFFERYRREDFEERTRNFRGGRYKKPDIFRGLK